MRNRFFAAGLLVLSVLSTAASAQTGDQKQGGRAEQGQRRDGPPLSPAEVERRVREEISRQLRRSLQLPDSQHNRLMTVSFRFRDSTLLLRDRERFINRELNLASSPAGARVTNDQRIGCLIDAFWDVQIARVNVRKAEDNAIAEFLTPAKRLTYLSIQERLHELMDDFLLSPDRRSGGGGPGGARGGGAGGGRPPQGQGVRSGGPPPGGRPGGPGRMGGAGGAFLQTLCPPTPR